MGKAKKLQLAGSAPNQTTLASFFSKQSTDSKPARSLFTSVVPTAGKAVPPLRDSANHPDERGSAATRPAVAVSSDWAALTAGRQPGGSANSTPSAPLADRSAPGADGGSSSSRFCSGVGDDDDDFAEIVDATPEKPPKKAFARSFLGHVPAKLFGSAVGSSAVGGTSRPSTGALAAAAHTTRPRAGRGRVRPGSVGRSVSGSCIASQASSAAGDLLELSGIDDDAVGWSAVPHELGDRENASPSAAASWLASKREAEKGCSPRAKKTTAAAGRLSAERHRSGAALAEPRRSMLPLLKQERAQATTTETARLQGSCGGDRFQSRSAASVSENDGDRDDRFLNDVLLELGAEPICDKAATAGNEELRKPSAAKSPAVAAAAATANGCIVGPLASTTGVATVDRSLSTRYDTESSHGSSDRRIDECDDDSFLQALVADLGCTPPRPLLRPPPRAVASHIRLSNVSSGRCHSVADGREQQQGSRLDCATSAPPQATGCVRAAACDESTGCDTPGRRRVESVDCCDDGAAAAASSLHFRLATVPTSGDALATTGDAKGRKEPAPNGRSLARSDAVVARPLAVEQSTFSCSLGTSSQSAATATAPLRSSVPDELQFASLARRQHVPCVDHGRHVVRSRQESRDSSELVLLLDTAVDDPGSSTRREATSDCSLRTCVLRGSWSDTLVEVGDTINVLGSFDPETGVCVVDDQSNFVVVHPDHLVSGTSVTSAVGCLRRAVFNEQCKGVDKSNESMLYGSVIHAVFQEVLQKKQYSKEAMMAIAKRVVMNTDFLHQMLICGVTEERVLQEVSEYTPSVESWIRRHVLPPARDSAPRPPPSASPGVDGVLVQKVVDIEENVLCPRLGLKGKVDVTLDVEIHQKRMPHSSGVRSLPKRVVLPLELKTGKQSFSSEHRGQVVLYTMMLSDRRQEAIDSGLLLYLKHDSMAEVKATHAEKRGLIQLRNQLCYYTKAGARLDADDQGQHRLPQLATGINVDRWCSRCPHLLGCTLYQRIAEPEAALPSDHPAAAVFLGAAEHLTPAHIKYYGHWLLLLRLEADACAADAVAAGGTGRRDAGSKSGNKLSALWRVSSAERELTGSCIGSMSLQDVRSGTAGDFLHCFVRSPDSSPFRSLEVPIGTDGLQQGDYVIVSREDGHHIGLAQGQLVERSGSGHVLLRLSRDLRNYNDWQSSLYSIDRLEYSSDPLTTNYGYLSGLMTNDPASQKLRELIIDGRKPLFNSTLSKAHLHTIKPLVAGLNKAQKGAILKALMCKDYVLISGYPGTGKTSTIVALVRSLVVLNYSVLVVSYTNSAVDTILLKLAQYGVDFVRCGKKSRAHPDLHHYSIESLTGSLSTVDELKRLYDSKKVVAATCHSVSQTDAFLRRFDFCVVDEASQTLQPTCIGSLLRADRFVFVGDDMQLPPIVTSHDARRLGMEESMFSRLRNCDGALFELTEQYRMNSEIMRLANELVYDSRLSCGSDDVSNATLKLNSAVAQKIVTSSPSWLEPVLSDNLSRAVVFLDVAAVERATGAASDGATSDDRRRSYDNADEARIVRRIVGALVECGVSGREVGVVTPFRAQVRLIQQLLSENSHCASVDGVDFGSELRLVEVSTVDQYQGRDKSAIVLSFVKNRVPKSGDHSDDGEECDRKGILGDLRRLNVALTRARSKLILVGNKEALAAYRPLRRLLTALRPEQLVAATTN